MRGGGGGARHDLMARGYSRVQAPSEGAVAAVGCLRKAASCRNGDLSVSSAVRQGGAKALEVGEGTIQ